jgi:hypothetical protein
MSDNIKLKVLFTQAEIAQCSGISQSMISYIFNGDRTPSVDVAERLEKCTGICREAWLFPERHFNPYDPIAGVRQCGVCSNRLTRMPQLADRILAYFKQAENKREAFKEMAKGGHIFNGYGDDLRTMFAEITDEGLVVLGWHGKLNGKEPYDFYPKRVVPQMHKEAKLGMNRIIKRFPYDLPASWKTEAAIAEEWNVVSAVFVSAGRIGFCQLSNEYNFYWTEEMSANFKKVGEDLDQIWKEAGYE